VFVVLVVVRLFCFGLPMNPATLADVIVVAHFLYAAFVVLGFAAIGLGAWRGWEWVRHRGFRWAHGLAMGFVGVEALIGMACPLTVWEAALRERSGHLADQGAFLSRIASRLLFYDLPPWVFTAAYLALTAAVLLLWRWVPPRCRGTPR
jgi:hypothetical protein